MPTKTQTPTKPKSFIGANTVLTISIPWKEAEAAYEQAKKKIAKTLKADGFRKGKVPAELAEQLAGQDKIVEIALQALLPNKYQEAITKAKKKPLTYPEIKPIKIEMGKDWELEVQIAEKPEIKLANYKKTVRDAIKEANKKIAETLKENAKKAAENKDTKAAKPEKNQEFTDDQKDDYRLQHIYQALVQTTKSVIPELLVKEEVKADLNQLTHQLEQVKLTFDNYLKRRSFTFEQLSQEMTVNALGKLQIAFVMDAVATEAQLSITETEIEAYINEKIDTKLKAQISLNPEYKRMIAQTLQRQKIVKHLLAL
ncbi:MAG: hypothetical protein COU66_00800 [Candidatus Pacebacteria bacterium CG10_big_fil_rev_8_21_14_0_10_44_11]|nr:MAG: hypothetical protein COU66_00800 [Candidatus Pacebacteria bacterium CG10_big_fil_rev_8_21_14_0_10_44_11]